jgi:hypothetical protein
MHERLTRDPAALEKTYKSLFQKLSYVMNLTKIKVNVKDLKMKL